MAISLRTSDPETAFERHATLTQLMNRGDWGVLEAIRAGEMHISDAVAALRDGDAEKLRRKGAKSPKLGEAFDRFIARKRATRSRNTVGNNEVRVRQFVGEFGRDFPMDALTAEDARTYLQAPKTLVGGKRPWAPSTQETVRVILGALWAMVMEEETELLEQRNIQPSIRRNPWKGLEVPEIRPTRAVFLSPEEWRDLDASMVGMRYRALVGLAVLAGLRQGEILHLRTGIDLELDGPDPVVRIQSRKDAYPWRPKTWRGERDVPITESLVGIIRAHLRLGFAGDRYLIRFRGKDEPISRSTAIKWTRQAFGAAGIKYGREGDGLTLHSGRHTYASWLAQDGVSLNVIAGLLGDTTKVVEDTYAHLIPDTFRSAVDNIERRATG